MQFLLLIYESESLDAARSEAENQAILQEYMEFGTSVRASGKLRGGEALKPVATATTVRVRDGKSVVTDGPFAETKEQLAGYTILDAKNLDEALDFVRRHPLLHGGLSIEIRPLRVWPAEP
jgi:hypothetical protein